MGDVPKTSAPEPVSPVTAAARLAEVGAPRKVATPVPSEVMPVPPLAGTKIPPSVNVPVPVMGPPVRVRPVEPPEPSTLVTVPPEPVAAIVMEPAPLVIATPEPAVSVVLVSVLPVVLPISSWPLVYVFWPVPPLATGRVPVTPVVRGRPVAFVSTPEAGVPSAGVTNVGEVSVGDVPNTSEPEPVSSVTAAARLAEVGVPRKVAIPAPNEVIPVPPEATGRAEASVSEVRWVTTSTTFVPLL